MGFGVDNFIEVASGTTLLRLMTVSPRPSSAAAWPVPPFDSPAPIHTLACGSISKNREFLEALTVGANEIPTLLGLTLCVLWLALVPVIRYRFRKWRSRDWPTVPGSIQRRRVRRGGPTKYQGSVYRSLFGYAYEVDGAGYVGSFALVSEDQEAALNLQTYGDGGNVTVRYNPKHPEMSGGLKGSTQHPF